MELDSIGKKIRDARIRKNLTQADLARLLNKSQRAISDYESGNHDISASVIPLLAHVLDVPILYFFEEQSTENLKSKILEETLLDEFSRLPDDTTRQAVIGLVRACREVLDSDR